MSSVTPMQKTLDIFMICDPMLLRIGVVEFLIKNLNMRNSVLIIPVANLSFIINVEFTRLLFARYHFHAPSEFMLDVCFARLIASSTVTFCESDFLTLVARVFFCFHQMGASESIGNRCLLVIELRQM